jgi:uncharacterized membrane protein YbjE (DUF340 family)
MIATFVITLIECLEIAFITLLLVQTNIRKRDSEKHLRQHLQVLPQVQIIMYGILGLIGGLLTAYYLHDMLENYEWLMYAILSGLFFYLFYRNKDIQKHIKEHVDNIRQSSSTVLFLAAFFIYGRESFEIFSNLFLNPNASWSAAICAAIVAFMIYMFARDSKYTSYVFKFGYWAYLAFGIWFGYEALEHLHIL